MRERNREKERERDTRAAIIMIEHLFSADL